MDTITVKDIVVLNTGGADIIMFNVDLPCQMNSDRVILKMESQTGNTDDFLKAYFPNTSYRKIKV